MYTKEDLKQGRVAVINDGTLDELRSLLREVFPLDKHTTRGSCEFYYKSSGYDGEWACYDSTNLPTQSIKDFIWVPKRGDKVLMSMNERDWEERIYVTTIVMPRFYSLFYEI